MRTERRWAVIKLLLSLAAATLDDDEAWWRQGDAEKINQYTYVYQLVVCVCKTTSANNNAHSRFNLLDSVASSALRCHLRSAIS